MSKLKKDEDIVLTYLNDCKIEDGMPVGVGIHSFGQSDEIAYHWHDYYEMELIVEGEITHTVNNKQYTAKRGDVYLVTLSDFHSIKFNTPEVKIAAVGFTPQAIPMYLADRVLSLDFSCASLDAKQFKILYRELEFFKEQYDIAPKISDNDLLRISFEKILLLFLDHISADEKHENANVHLRPLQKALDHMRKNYSEQITLEDAARVAEMVPTYFSRYFKQNMNIGFMQYLNRLRCSVAAAFLSTTELTIETISVRTGYMTASYFSKVFRSIYGVSPLEYRQKSNKE